MMHRNKFLIACFGAAMASGCASMGEAPNAPRFAANGYLSPAPTGDPIIIGEYSTIKECEDALNDWLARQVVGNPITGECLPIDRY